MDAKKARRSVWKGGREGGAWVAQLGVVRWLLD